MYLDRQCIEMGKTNVKSKAKVDAMVRDRQCIEMGDSMLRDRQCIEIPNFRSDVYDFHIWKSAKKT